MDWRLLLKSIHVALAVSPWFLVIWLREPVWIILCIAIGIIILGQWVVFERCLLHSIENSDGSTDSDLMHKVADWLGGSFEITHKTYVIGNFISPLFIMMSRLAAAMGL